MTRLPGSLAKRIGIVLKTSPGPPSGAKLKVKTIGKIIIAAISDIKADGPETVVFSLSGGSADFPYIMSDYHLSICPAKAEGGIDWESGVGTGGFTLQA